MAAQSAAWGNVEPPIGRQWKPDYSSIRPLWLRIGANDQVPYIRMRGLAWLWSRLPTLRGASINWRPLWSEVFVFVGIDLAQSKQSSPIQYCEGAAEQQVLLVVSIVLIHSLIVVRILSTLIQIPTLHPFTCQSGSRALWLRAGPSMNIADLSVLSELWNLPCVNSLTPRLIGTLNAWQRWHVV